MKITVLNPVDSDYLFFNELLKNLDGVTIIDRPSLMIHCASPDLCDKAIKILITAEPQLESRLVKVK
jgi:hypothetical protein